MFPGQNLATMAFLAAFACIPISGCKKASSSRTTDTSGAAAEDRRSGDSAEAQPLPDVDQAERLDGDSVEDAGEDLATAEDSVTGDALAVADALTSGDTTEESIDYRGPSRPGDTPDCGVSGIIVGSVVTEGGALANVAASGAPAAECATQSATELSDLGALKDVRKVVANRSHRGAVYRIGQAVLNEAIEYRGLLLPAESLVIFDAKARLKERC